MIRLEDRSAEIIDVSFKYESEWSWHSKKIGMRTMSARASSVRSTDCWERCMAWSPSVKSKALACLNYKNWIFFTLSNGSSDFASYPSARFFSSDALFSTKLAFSRILKYRFMISSLKRDPCYSCRKWSWLIEVLKRLSSSCAWKGN